MPIWQEIAETPKPPVIEYYPIKPTMLNRVIPAGRPPLSGYGGPLQPSSFGGNKPTHERASYKRMMAERGETPPEYYLGSALRDYVGGTPKTIDKSKPPSELVLDLRAHLNRKPANPAPDSPVEVLGRDRDPPERISTPSNQQGLPVSGTTPGARAPVDYHRKIAR
jgi:hypothetical protein